LLATCCAAADKKLRKELSASEAAAAAITDDSRRLEEVVATAQGLVTSSASAGGAAGSAGAELIKQALQLLAALRQKLYDRVSPAAATASGQRWHHVDSAAQLRPLLVDGCHLGQASDLPPRPGL
jgi:hypothetical protein